MLNYNLPTHCPSAEEGLNLYQAPADNEKHHAIDRQPDFSTPIAIALNRQSAAKTRFLRPEICENHQKHQERCGFICYKQRV